MAISATIQWKKSRYKPGESAYREYLVTEAPDENQAIVAAGVNKGDGFNLDGRLTAEQPEILEVKLPANDANSQHGIYVVGVSWKASQGGGGSATDLTPRYTIRPGFVSERVERDVDGNPLSNTAGDIFEGLSDDIVILYLSIIRWEFKYEIDKALVHLNAVNSDEFGFDAQGGGRIVIPKLLGRCTFIGPTGVVRKIDPIIEVQYDFEVRVPVTDIERDGVVSPHDWRLADIGFNGWYDDGGIKKRGKLYDGELKEAADPVRLNGGLPMQPDIFKVAKTHDAVAPPKPFFGGIFAELPKDDGGAWFLWYQRRRRVPFSGLEF